VAGGNGAPSSGDYRVVRMAGAIILILVAGLIVLFDSLSLGRPVEPLILGALLITAGGLLAVDLPDLRR
jgi:hypothetical protein